MEKTGRVGVKEAWYVLVLLAEVVAKCEAGTVGHMFVPATEVVIVDVFVGTGLRYEIKR